MHPLLEDPLYEPCQDLISLYTQCNSKMVDRLLGFCTPQHDAMNACLKKQVRPPPTHSQLLSNTLLEIGKACSQQDFCRSAHGIHWKKEQATKCGVVEKLMMSYASDRSFPLTSTLWHKRSTRLSFSLNENVHRGEKKLFYSPSFPKCTFISNEFAIKFNAIEAASHKIGNSTWAVRWWPWNGIERNGSNLMLPLQCRISCDIHISLLGSSLEWMLILQCTSDPIHEHQQ